MKIIKYRIVPDHFYGGTGAWQIEKKYIFWPFWIEVGNGLMTHQYALRVKKWLEEHE